MHVHRLNNCHRRRNDEIEKRRKQIVHQAQEISRSDVFERVKEQQRQQEREQKEQLKQQKRQQQLSAQQHSIQSQDTSVALTGSVDSTTTDQTEQTQQSAQDEQQEPDLGRGMHHSLNLFPLLTISKEGLLRFHKAKANVLGEQLREALTQLHMKVYLRFNHVRVLILYIG